MKPSRSISCLIFCLFCPFRLVLSDLHHHHPSLHRRIPFFLFLTSGSCILMSFCLTRTLILPPAIFPLWQFYSFYLFFFWLYPAVSPVTYSLFDVSWNFLVTEQLLIFSHEGSFGLACTVQAWMLYGNL